MADNTNLPWLNQTYAADNISDVYYQRIKVTFGDDGASTDVSAANPLPTNSLHETELLKLIIRELILNNHILASAFGIDIEQLRDDLGEENYEDI